MTSTVPALARFFDTYQRAIDQANPAASLALFSATFLAAGPDGARAVPVTAFAPVLAQRKRLFDQLGCRSTELVSLEEIPLDGRYALARTSWRMTFRRPDQDDEAVTAESTFLIDTKAEQILVYMAHQDIFAILRERGIMNG